MPMRWSHWTFVGRAAAGPADTAALRLKAMHFPLRFLGVLCVL